MSWYDPFPALDAFPYFEVSPFYSSHEDAGRDEPEIIVDPLRAPPAGGR